MSYQNRLRATFSNMVKQLQVPGEQYVRKTSAIQEEDLDQYKIFYIPADRKRIRTRVRAGAVAFTRLSDAEREAAKRVLEKKGGLPLPILTIWAPKETFLWVNPDRTRLMLRINLVGWQEMTLQDRVDYYNALEVEKAMEPEEPQWGSMTGRLSSSSPNLQGLMDLRKSLPPGPQRTALKNATFGLAYGMTSAKITASLKKP